METMVKLFSNEEGEILRSLNKFFKLNSTDEDICFQDLEWEKKYSNPVEMADIIGTFIENNNNYKINMWVSLDKNVLINVTDNNADEIIRYLYERFPYYSLSYFYSCPLKIEFTSKKLSWFLLRLQKTA